ncbi:hypothetical protein MNBD_NITROSPINAE01-1396 [hydrothermal vent metagenome]|uniref:Uncharacterized protein n=1 Tax=hydrothermal vent metagenome TaxID=652676 RepID=A0A3B1BP68_9ZZZZ
MLGNLRLQLLLIASVTAMAIAGCGASGSIDKPKGDVSPATTASIELNWPEGYQYDNSTGRLEADGGMTSLSAPSYVTRIILTVTGEGIDPPIVVDVPLDTLRTTVSVAAGDRVFAVKVETNLDVTFTGAVTVAIAPGFAGPLVIPLEVNGPPVILGISPVDDRPALGSSHTITVDVSDPDPDDNLEVRWRLFTPRGTLDLGTGLTVTVPPQYRYGKYTLEITVDDGHGGRDRWRKSFTVENPVNIVRVAFSNTSPIVGDTVTATVEMGGVPSGLNIHFIWEIKSPTGKVTIIENVKSVDIQIADPGGYNVSVTAKDQFGNEDTFVATIGGACGLLVAPASVTAGQHPSTNGGATVTWGTVATALSYNLVVYNASMVLQTTVTGLTGLSTVYAGPVSQTGNFEVQAVCGTAVGPASTTAGPVTYPGILKPLNLASWGSSASIIDMAWETDTNATSFKLEWIDDLSNSGTISGAISSATCPSGAPWFATGSCGTNSHACTSGRSYKYNVQEDDGTYFSTFSGWTGFFVCP